MHVKMGVRERCHEWTGSSKQVVTHKQSMLVQPTEIRPKKQSHCATEQSSRGAAR